MGSVHIVPIQLVELIAETYVFILDRVIGLVLFNSTTL